MQNLVHRGDSKCTHAGTSTCKLTDYTKLNLHSLKQAANTDLRWMKTAAQNGKHGRSKALGEKCQTNNFTIFFLQSSSAHRGDLWMTPKATDLFCAGWRERWAVAPGPAPGSSADTG